MAEEKKKATTEAVKKKTTGKKAAAAEKTEKKPKATTKKSPKAKKTTAKKEAPEVQEVPETTEATETTEIKAEAPVEAEAAEASKAKAEAPEATPSGKVKGVRKEAAKAAVPTAKPRPLPRPSEPSTLQLDPETRRLLNARKTNKASLPEFRRIDSHKKDKLDPSWRRPRGHHAQLRRKKKAKGAVVKAGYGSPAAVSGYHPSGYREVLVHRPADVAGIEKTEAIRIGRTVGRKKQLEIERVAREQNIKVLNPLNTFEGAQ